MTQSIDSQLASHSDFSSVNSEEKIKLYCETIYSTLQQALPEKSLESEYKTQTLSNGRKRYFYLIRERAEHENGKFFSIAQMVIDDDQNLTLLNPNHYTHPIRILNFYEPELKKYENKIDQLHEQLGFSFVDRQYFS